MSEMIPERTIHRAFEIGIVLKGVNAAIEALFGVLLLFTNVVGLVQTLIAAELIEDPDNFFATHLRALANPSHQAQIFGGLYLLSHGVIKGVLVIGLLRNKFWAYPASLAVLSLFIVYEVVRFFQTHYLPLLLLVVFDLVIVWLVWHEYRRLPAVPTRARS